ncbi:hypothetical protein SAMN05216311_120118 [Chitinophaga sp. CF418]|nr:hypothetical protein SAMN05216311_120118 [Chitinophaga sp. CF418]
MLSIHFFNLKNYKSMLDKKSIEIMRKYARKMFKELARYHNKKANRYLRIFWHKIKASPNDRS